MFCLTPSRCLRLSLAVILAIIFSSITTSAQLRKSAILKYDTAARPGKVLLADGTELRGDVLFNDNDGFVTIYMGDDSKSFNARQLSKFEFYGRQTKRTRLFYALDFEDPQTGLKNKEIFEVLKAWNPSQYWQKLIV